MPLRFQFIPRAPGSVNPTLTMNFTRAEFDVVILVSELSSGKS